MLRDYEKYPSLDTRILAGARDWTARAERGDAGNDAAHVPGMVLPQRHPCRAREESQHALAATADPNRSDVKFGETHLQLAPGEHGSTLVRYSTSITPGFWIPRWSAGAGCCAPSRMRPPTCS